MHHIFSLVQVLEVKRFAPGIRSDVLPSRRHDITRSFFTESGRAMIEWSFKSNLKPSITEVTADDLYPVAI